MGFLAAALALRRDRGGGPLTIMSCDNIPGNGRMLRGGLLEFCAEVYPGLGPWIEDNAAFPNSMVDRITPGTTADVPRYLEENFGLIDRWPVRAEDFRQWVLEDDFKEGVPPFAGAGALIVKDVEPYELMKIRLLNGSHSALAYPACLLGFRDAAPAILDPLLGAFIRRAYMEEITPTLRPPEGIDLGAYKDSLIRRFSNKNIGDPVLRLASDGSKKIPNAILRPLAEAFRRGLPRGALLFALAAWARFLDAAGDPSREFPLEDPRGEELSAAARRARERPAAFLKAAGLEEMSGGGLESLAPGFAAALEDIYRSGMRGALEAFMGRAGLL
jgi:mannitol 2-dehydrogenase